MASTSGGEAIVGGLVAHGVDTVFGLPGAQIYGLFDAFQQAQLRVIGARHEQAAGVPQARDQDDRSFLMADLCRSLKTSPLPTCP